MQLWELFVIAVGLSMDAVGRRGAGRRVGHGGDGTNVKSKPPP